jgi:hypothetical protein
VTSDSRGGTRYLPYAFTEQGVAMLSSVLRSPRAVEVNIAIMRTFVQLRRLMDSDRESLQTPRATAFFPALTPAVPATARAFLYW